MKTYVPIGVVVLGQNVMFDAAREMKRHSTGLDTAADRRTNIVAKPAFLKIYQRHHSTGDIYKMATT